MQQRILNAVLALAALTLALPASAALAQDAPPPAVTGSHERPAPSPHPSRTMRNPHRLGMGMEGRHMMTVTVTSVDKKTGELGVRSGEGMDLKLHFPPDSLAKVENGETLTVFLGFRTGDVKAERAQRRERAMNHKMPAEQPTQ